MRDFVIGLRNKLKWSIYIRYSNHIKYMPLLKVDIILVKIINDIWYIVYIIN